MTEDQVNGNTVTCTYWSLDEFADAADRRADERTRSKYNSDDWSGSCTFAESLNMARNGWDAELQAALDIAESAVDLCEREHEVMKFTEPVFDVSGDSVDIGRYLAGEPECMMDWPLQPTSTHGRVITLCASVAYSAAIAPDVIRRRGQVLVALAAALSRLGHSTELWIDLSVKTGSFDQKPGKPTKYGRVRVLAKGANDTLDPARIMFALAHPAMLRQLGFAVWDGFPGEFAGLFGSENMSRGKPCEPAKDLPEGTIYMPHLLSKTNIPDAHEALKGHLREIGLLAE